MQEQRWQTEITVMIALGEKLTLPILFIALFVNCYIAPSFQNTEEDC
jgi:hypothetical protein